MHSVHMLCSCVCLHWHVYVKNTAFKQCQNYMIFYLYENLPNKLTYGKGPETKKYWTVYCDSVKCCKCILFKKKKKIFETDRS